MPFLLFLLSVATLVAVSSKSKAGTPGGRTQTFTLDNNMPDALRNQVLAALVSGTDPATLDAFATAIQAQYPLSAGLLHAKATSLRAGLPTPTAGGSLPAPGDPGGPPLDPSMPAPLVAFVHTELANETDPMKLLTLANTLAAQYPIAANLLTQQAAVLNVQPSQPASPSGPPTPQPSPPAPSPTPTPANPSAPALTMPGLDPGMPPDVAQAVMGELIGDSDPAKLQALAQQIQGQYPLAANLLQTKANTLVSLQQPATPAAPATPTTPVQPIVAPPVPSGSQMGLDPNMPPQTVQLVLNELANEGDPTKLQVLANQLAPQYPIAAGLLNTRANVILATRPPSEIIPTPGPSPSPTPPATVATTYTVQQDDYPWKIAAHFTGHGARWPELVAANPQKAKGADGNFKTLVPGEKISLPGSWVAPSPPASPPPVTIAVADVAHPPTQAPAAQGALAPNIPPDVAAAVMKAVKTGSDPAQLRGFASAVSKNGYPVAAALLNAKANVLDPHSVTPTAVAAPSGSAAPATYKVKAGDSPSKIAAALVHDGNRWKELIAANPEKKRAANGNFASLIPGEVLQLPLSWSTHGAATPSQPQGGA